jgi:hypothetical protein
MTRRAEAEKHTGASQCVGAASWAERFPDWNPAYVAYALANGATDIVAFRAAQTSRKPFDEWAKAWSDLTVTDVFCGAGGNTIGAKKAGLRVRVGSITGSARSRRTGTNNPDVDIVERVDVSLCDPRRYHSTDIAIMSPECTTHSPAGGNQAPEGRRPSSGMKQAVDPATERSASRCSTSCASPSTTATAS